MKKIILLFGAIPLFAIAWAQRPDFEIFASRQDTLFQQAYDQKDIDLYQHLLDEFVSRYHRLVKSEQEKNAGFVRTAYYNFSCVYSLLGRKQEAIYFLALAKEKGYQDYQHLREDRDLDNIRGEKEFKSILGAIRRVGDYGYILAQASQYNPNDFRPLPEFTYQSSENVELLNIRKTLKLDSIAGKGNEALQLINLMHWVHGLIRHDGNHSNPPVRNTLQLIRICQNENRGLNCRGLAIILNECYLAMGFRSRYVTCLPKDSLKTDPDCHVINMVYSLAQKKWLWMDPTNDAYVMNTRGELLSIEEVRDHLVHKLPLILSPTANWNNQITQTPEDYLYRYMTKNLYMLQCPVRSEWNAESAGAVKSPTYITLVPLNYFNQERSAQKGTDTTRNTGYSFFQTNNPSVFWKAPAGR